MLKIGLRIDGKVRFWGGYDSFLLICDIFVAAKNMNGEPIPGIHWVEIDLGQLYRIRKFLIDWETAFSDSWVIQGKGSLDSEWREICRGENAFTVRRDKKHVIHEILFEGKEVLDDGFELVPHSKETILKPIGFPMRYVKLLIFKPSTQWGSSIWRFQIWGHD